jgi:hypothetical protein
MSRSADSPAAQALQATRAQRWDEAGAILARLIAEEFALSVQSIEISRDGYSLNSVNGFVRVAGGEEYFFKFHHEEGEEVTLEELYRGELLQGAGYPVDLPVYVSKTVGRQLLLYRRRRHRRFVDVCAELDFTPTEQAGQALGAQAELDALTARIYQRTLHATDAAQSTAEPIHQLFFHRLVDPGKPAVLGGRARRFFWDCRFDFGAVKLEAETLRSQRWRINGVDYADPIETLLTRSLYLLNPARLAVFGGVTAHGDAHNANVWWQESSGAAPRLVLFDPAFAGVHVPALLAEVKATFHNIFAHPLWLYSPAAAARRYRVEARIAGAVIEIDTDWRLSALRLQFLRIKSLQIWKPLLQRLARDGLLAAEWRETLRCALFCCPTLVMDPRAGGGGGHTPTSSALALAMAVRCGSEPLAGGRDEVSEFLDSIA